MGSSGANIGFRMTKDLQGNEYAQTIKINTNCAFDRIQSPLPQERRTIRVASKPATEAIPSNTTQLHFDSLPSGTKIEFLTTIQKILSTSRQKLREMFTREGVQYFFTEFKLTADKAVDYINRTSV